MFALASLSKTLIDTGVCDSKDEDECVVVRCCCCCCSPVVDITKPDAGAAFVNDGM